MFFSHYREDGVIQRTWVEGAGTQLPTGLHWLGAERDQQARLWPRGKHLQCHMLQKLYTDQQHGSVKHKASTDWSGHNITWCSIMRVYWYVCPGQDCEVILRVWQADLLEPGDTSELWRYSCDGDGLARAGWGSESFFFFFSPVDLKKQNWFNRRRE